MTSEDVRICHHCGRVGFDVSPRIVEVALASFVLVGEHQVPERFRTELRCMDSQACEDRARLTEEER